MEPSRAAGEGDPRAHTLEMEAPNSRRVSFANQQAHQSSNGNDNSRRDSSIIANDVPPLASAERKRDSFALQMRRASAEAASPLLPATSPSERRSSATIVSEPPERRDSSATPPTPEAKVEDLPPSRRESFASQLRRASSAAEPDRRGSLASVSSSADRKLSVTSTSDRRASQVSLPPLPERRLSATKETDSSPSRRDSVASRRFSSVGSLDSRAPIPDVEGVSEKIPPLIPVALVGGGELLMEESKTDPLASRRDSLASRATDASRRVSLAEPRGSLDDEDSGTVNATSASSMTTATGEEYSMKPSGARKTSLRSSGMRSSEEPDVAAYEDQAAVLRPRLDATSRKFSSTSTASAPLTPTFPEASPNNFSIRRITQVFRRPPHVVLGKLATSLLSPRRPSAAPLHATRPAAAPNLATNPALTPLSPTRASRADATSAFIEEEDRRFSLTPRTPTSAAAGRRRGSAMVHNLVPPPGKLALSPKVTRLDPRDVHQVLTQSAATISGATLRQAAKSGNARLCEALIRSDVDVNDPDELTGLTPLMLAATEGRIDATLHLLQLGADLEAASAKGLTALALAADAGRPAIVRVLLEAGANPQAHDRESASVVTIALRRLETVYAPEHALKYAAQAEICRLLVEGHRVAVSRSHHAGLAPATLKLVEEWKRAKVAGEDLVVPPQDVLREGERSVETYFVAHRKRVDVLAMVKVVGVLTYVAFDLSLRDSIMTPYRVVVYFVLYVVAYYV